MPCELPIGRTLRRFRRLNRIKQSHVAELLSVSQGTVSRWESGAHAPSSEQRARIERLIQAHIGENNDTALKRLVLTSTDKVHLVCDATHTLLAASAARASLWAGGLPEHLGLSLWRFATPEIEAAELKLVDLGWFDGECSTFEFFTSGTTDCPVPIPPGRVRWDTILLSDGRTGRLTLTL